MELKRSGLEVRRQLEVPLVYKGVELDTAYRLDLLVDEILALELKATEILAPIHTTQLLTYVKLLDLRLGLLLNFGQLTMREGITRVVNELPDRVGEASAPFPDVLLLNRDDPGSRTIDPVP
jgi:GxxExxY protein